MFSRYRRIWTAIIVIWEIQQTTCTHQGTTNSNLILGQILFYKIILNGRLTKDSATTATETTISSSSKRRQHKQHRLKNSNVLLLSPLDLLSRFPRLFAVGKTTASVSILLSSWPFGSSDTPLVSLLSLSVAPFSVQPFEFTPSSEFPFPTESSWLSNAFTLAR